MRKVNRLLFYIFIILVVRERVPNFDFQHNYLLTRRGDCSFDCSRKLKIRRVQKICVHKLYL